MSNEITYVINGLCGFAMGWIGIEWAFGLIRLRIPILYNGVAGAVCGYALFNLLK